MTNRTVHRRRGAVAVAGAAALALVIAGCSSSGNSTKTSSSPSPSDSSSSSSSAPTAAALPAVAACTSDQTASNTFALGSYLPLTGSLAFLAPPAIAGVGSALSDINAAGGVNGKKACIVSQDSSDGDHKAVGDTNIKKLLQSDVSAVVGPESSTVTENILPVTNPTGTIVFSPAATDDALTTPAAIKAESAHFFRDVAPNAPEGQALASQILSDVPAAKVGILVFNDAYGLNLRDTLAQYIKSGGGSVVYGDKGAGQEFPSTETSFGSIVSNVLAKKPDVIAIIAFDQTLQILPQLAASKFPSNKLYFVDGNLNNYTSDKGIQDLTGAKGTQQGNFDTKFQAKIDAWYTKNEGKGLDGVGNYGPESYDAVTILALAADLAGKDTSAAIQPYIATVTGSEGGSVCTTYAACLGLIQHGAKTIHYEGPSAVGPFNADHLPSTAYISVYQAVGKNTAGKFLTTVKSNIK